MIRDTVTFLRGPRGGGCSSTPSTSSTATPPNRDYALEAVRVATEAGAEVVALCDTNGGMLPSQVADVVDDVVRATGARIGIHCHNDTGCAVANSMAAVDAGATHVQGTVNGYGERTGNADLLTVVANLQLKKGLPLLEPHRLQESTRIAHAIAEVTNVPAYSRQPYVGSSAFAHKAGLHASAIKVDPDLYQHMDPKHVGNDMRMLVSDMAGRASIELKSRELGFDLDPTDEARRRDARPGAARSSRSASCAATPSTRPTRRSSCCCAASSTASLPAFFEVESWRVITDARGDDEALSEATVKVVAAGERGVRTGEGNGPVNALDHALRSALAKVYPEIAQPRAHRLQGAHPRRRARHGCRDPRAHRDLGRHDVVDDDRRRRQHPRGELGRARRVGHLRPGPRRSRPALTTRHAGLAGRPDGRHHREQAVAQGVGALRERALPLEVGGLALGRLDRHGVVAQVAQVVGRGLHVEHPDLAGQVERVGDELARHERRQLEGPLVDVHPTIAGTLPRVSRQPSQADTRRSDLPVGSTPRQMVWLRRPLPTW